MTLPGFGGWFLRSNAFWAKVAVPTREIGVSGDSRGSVAGDWDSALALSLMGAKKDDRIETEESGILAVIAISYPGR